MRSGSAAAATFLGTFASPHSSKLGDEFGRGVTGYRVTLRKRVWCMRQFVMGALLIGIVGGVAGTVQAAPSNPRTVDSSPVSKRITKYCDPVCEVQAQDSAFSLMIEAYRQFQGRQIQLDYEARLRAAAGLGKDADSLIIGTTLNSTRT